MAARVASFTARRCAALTVRQPIAFGFYRSRLSAVRTSVSCALFPSETSTHRIFRPLFVNSFSTTAESKLGPLNEDIEARVVNVVREDGSIRRGVPLAVALEEARSLGLDLVQVANDGGVICRMFNAQKRLFALKKSLKNSKPKPPKEVNFGVKTAVHDLNVKAASVRNFLSKGHKVKILIKFGKELHLEPKAYEQLNLLEEVVGTEFGTRDHKVVQVFGGISASFTPKSTK